MTDKLEHLLNGGKLETESGALVTFAGIEIEHIDHSIDSFDLDKLELCEIYISPEEKEIKTLKLKVKNLELKLEEFANPRQTQTSIKHKLHIHLNPAEVKEIENIFINNPKIDIELIANTFNVGHNVIRRIKVGKHTKTSSSYQTILLKNN